MLPISFGCILLLYSKVNNTSPDSLTLKTTTMSFSMATLRSLAHSRSLGRKQLKHMQVVALPVAKVTDEILEPASTIVVKRFQQQVAREHRQEQIILAVVLTMSMAISIGLLLLLLEII
jgi:hypothetical protein